jgi:hypothetical protein
LPRDLELLGNQLPELAFGQQAGEESTALLILKRFALQRQAQRQAHGLRVRQPASVVLKAQAARQH